MSDLQFADYRIDRARRQLRRGEETIPLPGKAFDLLAYMASNPGRLLLKDELLAAVWPGSFVEESNLTQNIFLLRKALKPGASSAILTVPGSGYQFTSAVSEMPEQPLLSRDPLPAAPAATLDANRARVVYEEEIEDRISVRESPVAVALLAAGLLAVCVAGWLGWQRWQDHVGGLPVQVVLADIEGTTGDSVLDRTLSNITRMELAQSPFVTVVSGAVVQQTTAQMRRKPDDPLDASVAREVCERTASQAVLESTVARTGPGYLLTEQAISCVDGASLAATSQKAANVDALPDAVNKASVAIRRGLGESRRTIARFDAPLLPVATGSLDALKDFTQASTFGQRGHYPEAIELLKQAVQLDPKFAAAYLNLSLYSTATLANDDAMEYLQKAYEFRDYGTQPTRFFIVARYHTLITQDLFESLRNYQAWADLYPRSPQPWSGLQNVNAQLGRWSDALVAARRTSSLASNNAAALQSLAEMQMRVGDFASSRKTCELAISKGLDGEGIRFLLFRLATLQRDPGLLQAQKAWLDEHPDSPVLLANEAGFAIQEGRVTEAQHLLDQMAAAFTARGQSAATTPLLQRFAYAFAGVGDVARADDLLHRGPITDVPEQLFTLVALKKDEQAEAILRKAIAAHPNATLLTQLYGPMVRGGMAINAGTPAEAVTLLEPARAFDATGVDGPYLRGLAYLQQHQARLAEDQFRMVLAHPGLDPLAWQLALARLQLARALSLEGNTAASISAYEDFLQLWINADSNLGFRREAEAELAALKAVAAAPAMANHESLARKRQDSLPTHPR